MLVKIYWSTWGLFALAFLLLFVSNNLSMMNLVVLGFVGFGLTFMGMMGVLPTLVAHPAVPKPAREKLVSFPATRESHAKAFHIFKSA